MCLGRLYWLIRRLGFIREEGGGRMIWGWNVRFRSRWRSFGSRRFICGILRGWVRLVIRVISGCLGIWMIWGIFRWRFFIRIRFTAVIYFLIRFFIVIVWKLLRMEFMLFSTNLTISLTCHFHHLFFILKMRILL